MKIFFVITKFSIYKLTSINDSSSLKILPILELNI